MTITLHHHPFSRAAGTVWALEEAGVPYELQFVDILKGAQKSGDTVAKNPMGKVPTLVDGDTVVTECAAIALYLADRYAYGRLAPKHDEAHRGTYLRWSFFAPGVIEPGSMAKAQKWEFRPGQAGWGTHEEMTRALESAVEGREWVLGDTFSMADVVFGGTLRYMAMVKMLEPNASVKAYIERLGERPALKRADAINAKIIEERGLAQKK